jgi:hypothetical protein
MKQAILSLQTLTFALGSVLALAGRAEAATITASGCSQAAVQAAINTAVDGDTVVVPSGSCTWTSPVSISGKGIHVKGQSKGSVQITHSAGQADLIEINSDASHHVELSNMRFLPGSVSNPAFYITVGNGRGKPPLIHDNYFRVQDFGVSCIRWGARNGVIWNNEFESLDPNGAGSGCIPIKAEDPASDVSWQTPSTFGANDVNGDSNVYFENNTFRKIVLQSLDPDGNARIVVRYNLFDNSGMASHGADTGPDGMRHAEIYNNNFVFTSSGTGYNFPLPLNWWIYIRGGSWVIADNTIANISSQMWGDKSEFVATVQNLRRPAGPYPCWTTYPAPRQFGQGHNGTSYISEPSYIWNNTGGGVQTPGLSDYDPDGCGADRKTSDFIRPNRDYFVDVVKPGYNKYRYPHPLTQLGSPAPQALVAPTNLRVN